MATLKDIFKVENIAPGHCNGEPTFAAMEQAFGDRGRGPKLYARNARLAGLSSDLRDPSPIVSLGQTNIREETTNVEKSV